jgi:acyl-CoA thioesterase FadM
VKEANGRVTEFVAEDRKLTPEQIAASEKRVMDCIDCHNRPTHIFKLPDQAMDESLAQGRIDRSIPYIKKIGVEVLKQAQGSKSAALEQIAQHVRAHYQQNYSNLYASRRETLETAIREIQAIYSRNVFPEMNLTWGTHPNNIGHERFTGCFRCHDEAHQSKEGKTISQDCSLCHTILAMEEQNPEILKQLELH